MILRRFGDWRSASRDALRPVLANDSGGLVESLMGRLPEGLIGGSWATGNADVVPCCGNGACLRPARLAETRNTPDCDRRTDPQVEPDCGFVNPVAALIAVLGAS